MTIFYMFYFFVFSIFKLLGDQFVHELPTTLSFRCPWQSTITASMQALGKQLKLYSLWTLIQYPGAKVSSIKVLWRFFTCVESVAPDVGNHLRLKFSCVSPSNQYSKTLPTSVSSDCPPLMLLRRAKLARSLRGKFLRAASPREPKCERDIRIGFT